MYIRSREVKSNRVTVAINARTKKEEQLIKEEIQKALLSTSRLLEKELSYEIYLKFNERALEIG